MIENSIYIFSVTYDAFQHFQKHFVIFYNICFFF